MRLLADTDAFCKLAAVGLLDEAARALGANRAEVERLAALPYMLRKGKKLRKQFGEAVADQLATMADAQPIAPAAPTESAALLTGIDNIDVGEVQLFALAASADLLLISGDKRAVTAIAGVAALVPSLNGKIVCLEALLHALCHSLGAENVRTAIAPRAHVEKVFQICFSTGSNPLECLGSYLRDLQRKVFPLLLWLPSGVA